MRRIRRVVPILSGLILLTGLLRPVQAQAIQPDTAYTYNNDNEAVPSTNAFQVKVILDGDSLACGGFSGGQDIFVDSEDQVYLLDSGKRRVIWFDENYELVKVIDTFTWNGEPYTLANGALGIFFHEPSKSLYIADTQNNRIIVCDRDGVISKVYEKPESKLLDNGLPYAPRKIIVDNMGIMYVLSQNINTGALLIDKNNNFLTFYGVNEIKETTKVVLEYKLRRFMTEEQRSQSENSFQPTELTNLYWTSDRFVYAVSPVSETIETPVVKLNAVGDNVLTGDYYADLSVNEGLKTPKSTPIFADITADSEGVFTILDTKSGKLYQYDSSCNLLAIFGGLGTQQGLFSSPTAIECNSRNEILVLDSSKNTITVMEQTYYGQKIREALFLYNDGQYEAALEPWFEVLRMNANYSMAYVGIGKAYMSMEDYAQAKYYFRLADDKENFALAKEALREVTMRKHFA